jgi:hypothetical protein
MSYNPRMSTARVTQNQRARPVEEDAFMTLVCSLFLYQALILMNLGR